MQQGGQRVRYNTAEVTLLVFENEISRTVTYAVFESVESSRQIPRYTTEEGKVNGMRAELIRCCVMKVDWHAVISKRHVSKLRNDLG